MLDPFRIGRCRLLTDTDRQQELHHDFMANLGILRHLETRCRQMDRPIRLGLDEPFFFEPCKGFGNGHMRDSKLGGKIGYPTTIGSFDDIRYGLDIVLRRLAGMIPSSALVLVRRCASRLHR